MRTEQLAEELADEQVDEHISSPGEVLREERLRQNLGEKDVADKLHITIHYLKAIESNSYEKLPGAIFVKGYIKSYAELLKLDSNRLLELYVEHTNRQLEKEKEKTLIQVKRRRDRNRPWVIVSVIGFIGGFTGLWAYNNFLPANDPVVIAPAISEPAPAEAPSASSSENTPVQSPINEQAAILIPLTENSGIAAGVQELSNDAVDTTSDDLIAALTALADDAREDETSLEPLVPPLGEVTEPSDRVIEIFAAGSDVLRIAFSGESWVEVNDEGQNQIYRDIRGAGDILEITGSAPFYILLGDAPFTNLTFNGTEIDVSDDIRIDNSARLTVGL